MEVVLQDYQNIMLTGMKLYCSCTTPDQAYAVQLNYIITPPSFTSTNNTYLSEYQQGMLLDGVLTEAYAF